MGNNRSMVSIKKEFSGLGSVRQEWKTETKVLENASWGLEHFLVQISSNGRPYKVVNNIFIFPLAMMKNLKTNESVSTVTIGRNNRSLPR